MALPNNPTQLEVVKAIKDIENTTIIELKENGSTTAGTWLAKTDKITALQDGQLFLYKIAVAGASTTTLNITANGTALGAITIYRVGTTKLTTQYGVGQYLLLIYNTTNTCFRVVNDYDANSYAYVRQYQAGSNAAGSGTKYPVLTRYNLTNKNASYDTAYSRYHTGVTIDTSNGNLNAPTISENGTALSSKYQPTLVSGTNIKTINGNSLLGSGDLEVGGGSATDVKVNGTSITSGGVANIVTESAYNASTNKIATKNDITKANAGLSNVANERQYSANNPPPAPSNMVTTNTTQTISGAKTLSTDLTFNASVQTQLIYKTNGTITGLIRSGILNGTEKYIVQQADKHYWGSIANANRVIFDSTNKKLYPETDNSYLLGGRGNRWNEVNAKNLSAVDTGTSAPNVNTYMTADSYTATPSATASTQYLARDKNGNWMGGVRFFHQTSNKYQVQLFERHHNTTYGTYVMLETDADATSAGQAGKTRFIPQTNGTIDLGTSNNKWRNIYGVNVYATSDRRLKENIKDAELDCGAVIDDLPIKEFNFKSDEEKKVVVGAIAQELQEILPEKYRATLVSGSEDTSYSINEGKLLYVAIGALKEERAKTKELEERLAKLEKMLGV